MKLEVNVFDVWAFRRTASDPEYLLLHTSQHKADRYFNGGRFWQVPSGFIKDDEDVVSALARQLATFGLEASAIWAAEHAYTIYNRRFACMQIIAVYAAEVAPGGVQIDPAEHSEYRWCSYEEAQSLVNYRGLKDGLRSTREYVTGLSIPPRELHGLGIGCLDKRYLRHVMSQSQERAMRRRSRAARSANSSGDCLRMSSR